MIIWLLKLQPIAGWVNSVFTLFSGFFSGVFKGVGAGGITDFIGGAFKSNPIGTVTGIITLVSVVGVPMYKAISNGKKADVAQTALTDAMREKDAATLEANQRINLLTNEKDTLQQGYEQQLSDLKNDDVMQKLLSTQTELAETKKAYEFQLKQNQDLQNMQVAANKEQIKKTLEEVLHPKIE